MPATTYADMINQNQALIRKPQAFAIFMAPYATTLPTTLTTGASQLPEALPAGYEDIGFLDKEAGASWTREIENSDVLAVGATEPVRRDITSDVSGLTFTALESKKLTFEIAHNVDLSAVEGTAVTGEVAYAQATQPATKYYRLIAIGMDGAGADAFYFARSMPRVAVTSVAEQAWNDGQALTYAITVTAFKDPTAGYAIKHYWGGPGWLALAGASGHGFVTDIP